jgi:hypothetical protein
MSTHLWPSVKCRQVADVMGNPPDRPGAPQWPQVGFRLLTGYTSGGQFRMTPTDGRCRVRRAKWPSSLWGDLKQMTR